MALFLNPRTGQPIDTDPDDVQPGDLQSTGRPDLKLESDPIAMAARRYQSVDKDVQAREGTNPVAADDAQPAQPEEQPPAQDAAPAAAPVPPAPAPRQSGGGGGGLPKQQLGISQGEQAALDRQSSADTEALNVNARKGGLEQRKAAADLDLAQQEQAAHQQFDQHAEKVRSQAMDYLQQKRDEASKYEITDFFQDRPAAMRTQAALWVGLGAFASAFNGGPNEALEIINQGIERDHKLKLEHAEKLSRNVTDARAGIQDADIELKAQEAGMLRKLADQRAVHMKKFGADDAAIANDELRVKLLQEASAREVQAQQGIENRIEGQRKLYIQETVGRSEAAKNYAEAGKLKAEAGAGPGMKGDRAAGHKIDLGIFGAGVVDALKEAKGLKLSDAEIQEALQTVQKNETTLKSQEGPKSPASAWLSNKLRDHDLLPKSRTDGLSEKQTQFINKLDIAQKKVATVLAGQGRANSHEMMEALRPQPGDGPQAIRQKLIEMAALGQSAKDEAMQYGDIAAGAIEKTKAAAAAEGGSQRPAGVPEGATPVKVRDKRSGQVIDAWKLPNGRLAAVR